MFRRVVSPVFGLVSLPVRVSRLQEGPERSRPTFGKTEIVGWGDARPSGDDRFSKEKDIVDNLVEVVEAGLGPAESSRVRLIEKSAH